MNRSPALFVGHGNPMNAITSNPWRQAWLDLGARLPRPQAILCVSAHWETEQPQVCNAAQPETIHDFGGFPPALFAQQYPAPGAPALAARVSELAAQAGRQVTATPAWGLDHGAWSLLASLFPKADVPVCQLSLARAYAPSDHLALARCLQPLRNEGVLVLCSGNIVHNLRRLDFAGGPAPDWAVQFDTHVARALEHGDEAALLDIDRAGWAVPTPEHYLPLLYAAGLRHPQDQLAFFNTGFDLGSLSMRSFVLS